MDLIEITQQENGAHDNRYAPGETSVPDGWAVIPEGMKVPESFPFVDIETEERNGVMTVVSMAAREVPQRDEAKPEPTMEERMKTLEEQNEMLKQCLLEMSETVYA